MSTAIAPTSWQEALAFARRSGVRDIFGRVAVTDGESYVFEWPNGTYELLTWKTLDNPCNASDVVAGLIDAGSDPEQGWMPLHLEGGKLS